MSGQTDGHGDGAVRSGAYKESDKNGTEIQQ